MTDLQLPQPPLPAPRRGLSPLAWVLTLSAVFFVLFVVITGGVYLSRTTGGGKGAGLTGEGQVGIVELNGVIMDSKKTLKRLERFAEDDSIQAIVVRINSPGGAVAPSQEIYEAVKAIQKPVVASMSSVAASGGYYVATAAKKIYANPGTITGSIGVIMEFVNLQKLYEWAKVQRYSVKTGKFKDVGAEYKELSAEDRQLLQGMVDDVLSQFKAAVAQGRKLSMEQVTALADGRIFSGQQAKKAKLVDELGTLQDAVNEAGKMAGLSGKPKVVYPEKGSRSKLLELLLDNGSEGEEGASSRAGEAGLAAIVRRVAGAALGTEAAEALPEPGIYWLWKGAR